MFNKDFLKTLNVLYVEDDEVIRASLSKVLKKVFKEVISCVDGKDGISSYELYTKDMDMVFDVVITDINMPNLNGLEMVKQIRKYDQDIPIIITTAHGESEYLMEAIKQNVSGYTLKPIDTKELLNTIQKFCEIKRDQKLIKEKEVELLEYIELINKVATIVKIDNQDNIIEANEFFCALIGKDEDELIGSSLTNLICSDFVLTQYKKMKSSIDKDQTWKGKLKFISNVQEKFFFLRSTTMPIKDDNTREKVGYVLIGFLADEEEIEKQETINKVKQNILAEKQKVLQLSKQVKTLRAKKQKNYSEPNSIFLKETLVNEREKNNINLKQIEYYEYEIAKLKDKINRIIEMEKTKKQETLKKINELSKENALLKDKLITAQNQIAALTPKPKYVE